jgi:hypothetical protein
VFQKTQYLHLSAYPCEKCRGPVVAASLGIRETELTREMDVRHIRAVCLFCGNQQTTRTTPVRDFFPAEWDLSFRGIPDPPPTIDASPTPSPLVNSDQ